MAGRKCTICSHDEVEKINSLIGEGKSFRAISRQIQGDDSMRESIRRHTEDCLNLEIQVLIKEKKIKRAINHYEEITEQLDFAKELRIAARKYLSCPETNEIVLIPRSDEVEVVYFDHKDLFMGQPKRKRAKLDALLEEIFMEGGKQADKWSIKHVDIRSFALDAIKTADIVLDKIAKLGGLYQQDRPNASEAWKRWVTDLVAKGVVKDVYEAIALAKDEQVGYLPPNEQAEREVINEIGTIG